MLRLKPQTQGFSAEHPGAWEPTKLSIRGCWLQSLGCNISVPTAANLSLSSAYPVHIPVQVGKCHSQPMEYSLIAWQSWEVGWHLHTPWCSGVIPGYLCQIPAVRDFSSLIWPPVILFSYFLLICLFPMVWQLSFHLFCLLLFICKHYLDICHWLWRWDHRTLHIIHSYMVIQGRKAVQLQRSHVWILNII